LATPRRNGLERKVIMMLAHIFGMRGHGFGGGFLFFLIALACVVIILTWHGKNQDKDKP
jgi:hypothetical protein